MMGSIPKVCRSLRLFGPLRGVLCTIPQRYAMPPENTIIFTRARSSAVVMGYAPACGPGFDEGVCFQATKTFQLQEENRFAPCARFPRGPFSGKTFRGPRLEIPASHRPLHKPRSRPCGEPAIASPTFDGCDGQDSLVTIPIALDSAPFPRHAARLFAGHDCDTMKCTARSPIHSRCR